MNLLSTIFKLRKLNTVTKEISMSFFAIEDSYSCSYTFNSFTRCKILQQSSTLVWVKAKQLLLCNWLTSIEIFMYFQLFALISYFQSSFSTKVNFAVAHFTEVGGFFSWFQSYDFKFWIYKLRSQFTCSYKTTRCWRKCEKITNSISFIM